MDAAKPGIIYSLYGKRVWVAGHRGMVGSALVRALETRGDVEIVTTGTDKVDLRDQASTGRLLAAEKPDVILLAAAKVGGIHANDTYPGDFLYDNLMIEANVIHAAHRVGVEKLLFLGSSCIYPKFAPQPISEDSLLTGPLEPTNEWYAVAKIAGLKLCQAYRRQHGCHFISAMPTNLYGPNDNFDLTSSHVLPALIRKIHDAKIADDPHVIMWGTGTPRREFMHVDDLASACLFLTERYDEAAHINVGVGDDIEIRRLAQMIADIVGYRGHFIHDTSKPDGTPRKLMDNSRLTLLGWRSGIDLENGIQRTYEWFLSNTRSLRTAPQS